MQEGLSRFTQDYSTPITIDPILFGDLNYWRNELRKRELIGQAAEKYGGRSYGNVSCRLPPFDAPQGRRPFLITASQTSIAKAITEDQYAQVISYDLARHALTCAGKYPASSESPTHAALYDCNPWIRAVFHVHDKSLWERYREKLPTTATHADNGSQAMVREVQRLYAEGAFDLRMPKRSAFVMGGHLDGLCIFGRTIEDAGKNLIHLL